MTTTTYCDEQAFLDYIKSNADIGNDNVTTALEAASRSVDLHCGRRFYSATETRYFSPDSSVSLYVVDLLDSDIATLDDLEVGIGTDGTWATALTEGVDFTAEPLNRPPGWPYTRLRAIATPFPGRLTVQAAQTIQITGTFGWLEVPAPIKLATKILAAQFYKLADAPLGVAGWGAYGELRVREIPQVATLLQPYRKGSTFGIA